MNVTAAGLGVLGYLGLNILTKSTYSRTLQGDGKTETVKGTDALKHREIVDEDEVTLFKTGVSDAVEDTKAKLSQDPHWGKTICMSNGTLTIDNVEALPEPLRKGLFSKNADYATVSRINVICDEKAGIAVPRIAIKIDYDKDVLNVYSPDGKAKEFDLLMCGGVPGENRPGHEFFFGNAKEMNMFAYIGRPSLATLGLVGMARNWPILAKVFGKVSAVVKAYVAEEFDKGVFGVTYFSLGPFACGEGIVKYSLQPKTGQHLLGKFLSVPTYIQGQKDGFVQWQKSNQDAEFDLMVQVATQDCIPEPKRGQHSKNAMATEMCDLHWDESKSPYVRVGTFKVKGAARDLCQDYQDFCPLQFNAWNTDKENRPLGQLFRMRRLVHENHAQWRVQHQYNRTPNAMVGKCPFAR